MRSGRQEPAVAEGVEGGAEAFALFAADVLGEPEEGGLAGIG